MPLTFDSLIRVSKLGERDPDEAETIREQQRENLRAIQMRGGQLGREVRAVNQSGGTVIDTPAWRDALERCKRGESNGIVVTYTSRLARNARALGGFLAELEAAGGDLIVAGMPGVDYRTMGGSAIIGIMGIMDDLYFRQCRERGLNQMESMATDGVPIQCPYGYRRNGVETEIDGTTVVLKTNPARHGKTLVPDDGTAKFVKLIFERRADKRPWSEIRDELGSLDAPLPGRSGAWQIQTLRSMTRQRMYLGEVKIGKRIVLDAHEPLVSVDLFNRAQSNVSVPHTGRFSGGLAAGLLRCSSCGGTMSTRSGKKIANGELRLIYGCHRFGTRGACERPMTITRAPVDAFLDGWVMSAIRGELPLALFAESRELESAHAALAHATQHRARMIENAGIGELHPDDVADIYRRARTMVDEAQVHYDSLLARTELAAQLPSTPNAWSALDEDGKRRVLGLLIDHIDVRPAASRSRMLNPVDRLSIIERS